MKRLVGHVIHAYDHGEDQYESDDDYAPAEGGNADVNGSQLPGDIPRLS